MLQRLSHLRQFAVASVKDFWYTTKDLDFPEHEHADQTGKVWIVTGSTNGIGFELSLKLARLGATVWIVGRNKQRAEDHVAKIKAQVPSAKVYYLVMDLSDLSTIKPGVAKFIQSGSPLHGVVHNAGIMNRGEASKTPQGYELSLGTNVLAPWLLQKLLDPILLQSTRTVEGRIVWVSSLLYLLCPFTGDQLVKDPTNVGEGNGEAYAVTKAMNVFECIQWTKLHPTANVRSTTVHPGIIQTDMAKDRGKIPTFINQRVGWPVHYGAISELCAAIGDVPDHAYIMPWGKIVDIRTDILIAAERDTKMGEWWDAQVKGYQ